MTHDVGMPLCAGITAFEEEHYETATNCLKSVYGSLQRIGGSNAQVMDPDICTYILVMIKNNLGMPKFC